MTPLPMMMADGPPDNLPRGMDAYAGYVDQSGIGITYPEIVARFPAAKHVSISVHGTPAIFADVEHGAMASWAGYVGGYCSVGAVNALVRLIGRPRRLWTAHYTGKPHLCSPACWPGLVTTADATQFADYGSFDQSVLADDFFDGWTAPVPAQEEYDVTFIASDGKAQYLVSGNTKVIIGDPAELETLLKGGIPALDATIPLTLANIPTATG